MHSYHIVTGISPLTETRDRLARLNVSRFNDVKPILQLEPDCPPNVVAVCNRAMELDPEKRYQTPGQMLGEVQVMLRRLEAGDTGAIRNDGTATAPVIEIDPEALKEGKGKTVLIVEDKMDLQDLIREKLKNRGYRVLVYGDPMRALERFTPDEPPPADCAVFSAPELGNIALEAFNRFGTDEHTKHLPSILLVDRKQQHIIRSALVGPKRILLAMPLKVRELRAALMKLLAAPQEIPATDSE